MSRMMVGFVVLIISPLVVFAAAEGNIVATTPIGNPESHDTTLTECFVTINVDQCDSAGETIVLNWWPWSDETGSNWPDDDAKARAGELLINLSQENSTMVINEALAEQDVKDNSERISALMPIIELSGQIHLIKQDSAYRIEIPIEMTASLNLSDSTIMYIFLSKQYAQDDHRRSLGQLIYEMKPELGFSNQANNTTSTTWLLADTHLSAAGVNFEDSKYDWYVTLALFGSLESDSTNQLLSLHHVKLSTEENDVEFSEFIIPIFAVIFCVIIITTIIANMYQEEKGMPVITGFWHMTKTNCLVVEFTTRKRRMEIKSCAAEAPWKLASRFKSRFIDPEQTVVMELKFKESVGDDCRLNIKLEVEELGVWTQYLTIPSPRPTEEQAKIEDV